MILALALAPLALTLLALEHRRRERLPLLGVRLP
jgi:hypothetical protein